MADISNISALSDGIMRTTDMESNTLVTTSVKVGGASPTELTKVILDKLILMETRVDVDGKYLSANVTVAATPTNYTAGSADVEAHLSGIDTALSNASGDRATQELDNLGTTSINAGLFPDGLQDFGASTNEWNNIYANVGHIDTINIRNGATVVGKIATVSSSLLEISTENIGATLSTKTKDVTGSNNSGRITSLTGNSTGVGTGNTGNITIGSGQNTSTHAFARSGEMTLETGQAVAGGSGNINLTTGSSPSSRGKLAIDAESVEMVQVATPVNPAATKNKLYFKNDDNLYKLDSAGNEVEIGAGGGGGLDDFHTETFETTVAADFSKGNAATPDIVGTGSFDGTLSDDTTLQLAGDSSLKYVMGSSSTNDFFLSPAVSIDQLQTNNTVGFTKYFNYDGTDGDLKVIVLDESDNILTSSLDLIDASSTDSRYSLSFYIPDGVTAIHYGVQVVTGNSGKIFRMDNVTISTNPFVYKQLVDDPHRAKYYITSSSSIPNTTDTYIDFQVNKYTEGVEILGAGGGNVSATNTGFRAIIKKDGLYNIHSRVEFSDVDLDDNQFIKLKIFINGALKTISTYEQQVTSASVYVNHSEVTDAYPLVEGDRVEVVIEQTSGTLLSIDTSPGGSKFIIERQTSTTEHVVTPTKSVPTAKLKGTVGTSLANGVLTFLGFHTIDEDRDSFFSNVNSAASTTYTSTTYYTVPSDGKYRVASDVYMTAAVVLNDNMNMKIYKNGAGVAERYMRFQGTMSNASTSLGIDDTQHYEKGDKISIAFTQSTGAAEALNTSTARSHFTVQKIDVNAELAAIPTNYANVNPNILINGDMRVEQRGLLPVTGVVSSAYYMDRWKTNRAGALTANASKVTSSQPSSLSGSSSYKITASNTNVGYSGADQYVEDFALYAGKTVTYSVWVKSNTSNVQIWAQDNVNGGAQVTYSGGGAWEFLTGTFTVSSSPTYLRLIVRMGNNIASVASGDYIEFTGAKLELGSSATAFVPDSFGDSLRKCQRYYEIIGSAVGVGDERTNLPGYMSSTTLSVNSYFFKVEKRNSSYTVGFAATGSFRLYGGGSATVTNITKGNASTGAVVINSTTGTARTLGDITSLAIVVGGVSSSITIDNEL